MLLQTRFLTLTDDNFQSEVEQARIPVLIDCWALWCLSQPYIDPIFYRLAAEFAGRVLVGRLNVAVSKQTAAKYDIRAVPTLIIFSHGKIKHRITGMPTQSVIAQHLNSQLQTDMNRSLVSCP